MFKVSHSKSGFQAHIQIEMLLSSWVKLSGLQGLARTHGAVEYCSDQRQGAA